MSDGQTGKSMGWQGPVIAVVIAVLALLGYFLTRGQAPDAPVETAMMTPDAVTDPAPQPAPVPAPEPNPAPVAEPTPDPAPVAEASEDPADPLPPGPSFDLVRVDPTGSTLVAGEATPRSQVEVLVDGTLMDSPKADYTGQFVSLFTLAPSDQPRSLTVGERLEDGRLALSDARILIAPFGAPEAPVEMAEATPTEATPDAPDTAPTADTPTETVAEAPVEETPTPAAPKAPALLLEQGGEVALLQPSAPAEPTDETLASNVIIDTISYSPRGNVLLAGRAAMEAFVRIYLNNEFLTTTEVAQDGTWKVELEGIDPGVYTLRVDELSVTGAVLSRFETPFKREDPEQLAKLDQPDPAPASEAPSTPATPSTADAVTAPLSEEVATAAPTDPAAPATPILEETAAPADPDAPQRPKPAPGSRPEVQVVTVQPGFSLWKIATAAYGEGELYVRVYEANKDQIRDPDLIYPGQVFELPAAPAQ